MPVNRLATIDGLGGLANVDPSEASLQVQHCEQTLGSTENC